MNKHLLEYLAAVLLVVLLLVTMLTTFHGQLLKVVDTTIGTLGESRRKIR